MYRSGPIDWPIIKYFGGWANEFWVSLLGVSELKKTVLGVGESKKKLAKLGVGESKH
jgi:hypothetical protein